MIRTQASKGWTARLATGPRRRRPRHRLVLSLAVLVTVFVTVLSSVAVRSALTVEGSASPAGGRPRQRRGRRPDAGTERIRTAVTDAGFSPDGVEVTASRTPTGLDADAVEAAVKADGNCIVGRVPNGSVSAVILPVLAEGRCLVGSTETC